MPKFLGFVALLSAAFALGCAMKEKPSNADSSPTTIPMRGQETVVVISWSQDEGRIAYFMNGQSMGFDEVGFERIVAALEKNANTRDVFPILNPQYVLPMEPSADVMAFPFKSYSPSYSKFLNMTHGSWAFTGSPMDQVVKAYANDK